MQLEIIVSRHTQFLSCNLETQCYCYWWIKCRSFILCWFWPLIYTCSCSYCLHSVMIQCQLRKHHRLSHHFVLQILFLQFSSHIFQFHIFHSCSLVTHIPVLHFPPCSLVSVLVVSANAACRGNVTSVNIVLKCLMFVMHVLLLVDLRPMTFTTVLFIGCESLMIIIIIYRAS